MIRLVLVKAFLDTIAGILDSDEEIIYFPFSFLFLLLILNGCFG